MYEMLEAIREEDDVTERLNLIDNFKEEHGVYPDGNIFIEHGFERYGNKMNILEALNEFKKDECSDKIDVDVTVGECRFVSRRCHESFFEFKGKKHGFDELINYSTEIHDMMDDSKFIIGEIKKNPVVLKFYLVYHLNVLGDDVDKIQDVLVYFMESSLLELLENNITQHITSVSDWIKSLNHDEVEEVHYILNH